MAMIASIQAAAFLGGSTRPGHGGPEILARPTKAFGGRIRGSALGHLSGSRRSPAQRRWPQATAHPARRRAAIGACRSSKLLADLDPGHAAAGQAEDSEEWTTMGRSSEAHRGRTVTLVPEASGNALWSNTPGRSSRTGTSGIAAEAGVAPSKLSNMSLSAWMNIPERTGLASSSAARAAYDHRANADRRTRRRLRATRSHGKSRSLRT